MPPLKFPNKISILYNKTNQKLCHGQIEEGSFYYRIEGVCCRKPVSIKYITNPAL